MTSFALFNVCLPCFGCKSLLQADQSLKMICLWSEGRRKNMN